MANYSNDMYEGGIPESTDSIYPKVDNEGETQYSPAPGAGGEGRIGYTNSGPTTMGSSYGAQTGDVNFVDDASYQGDMSVPRPGVSNPSIVNPDKLSSSVDGGAKGLDY